MYKVLLELGAKLRIKYLKHDRYFPTDKECRNIYTFRIQRGKLYYQGTFGDSLQNSREVKNPSEETILNCLTWYDPESFSDFCTNLGYDEDSRTAYRIYKAVCREFNGLARLFTPDERERIASAGDI